MKCSTSANFDVENGHMTKNSNSFIGYISVPYLSCEFPDFGEISCVYVVYIWH